MKSEKALPHDAAVQESHKIERLGYNQYIGIMQEMVSETITTSAGLLESASALEEENKKLKQKLKEEQERYVRDFERLRHEERVAREKLRETIIVENEKSRSKRSLPWPDW